VVDAGGHVTDEIEGDEFMAQDESRRARDAHASTQAGTAPRLKILVTAEWNPEAREELAGLGDVEYASFREEMRVLVGAPLVSALQGKHVFVTEVDIVDAAALQRLPALRVVAACRGNAVNVDVDACTACGIPVLYAPGRNAEAVADLTLAYLLMLARELPAATAFLRRPGGEAGDMSRMGQAFSRFHGRELGERTVGLVGFGAVGRSVARRLAGFGARVVVFDPAVADDRIVAAGAEPVSLDTLLAASDFVSLHAEVNDTSRGLIGARELQKMKTGAALINTARSALVDEDALAAALQQGHIGGAALDVFDIEPPSSDHALLRLDNVIATPHIGGNTVDIARHQGRIIVADLQRIARGEPPQHVLNPAVLDVFDWTRPRPAIDEHALGRLAATSRAGVADVRQTRAGGTPVDAPRTAGAARPALADETRDRMARIVTGFAAAAGDDAALRALAGDKDVILQFTLTDLDVCFWLSLRDGLVAAGVDAPAAPADVQLKMRAEVFDGMFTGTANPMQAAMDGRLSFSGDTTKAMTLAELQEDLSRLYVQCREKVGDPGNLTTGADPAASTATGQGVQPGDIRHALIDIVNELYARHVITSTGGNVSARNLDEAGLWITPSQLFKGALRPESLVRIGLDGEGIDPDAPQASSERLMHCAVYAARPDAQAVVHAHAPHATILANARLPFVPISTEAAFFGEIPRVPFIMPGTQALADAIGIAMRDSWAVLMENHGILVAARSLRRAADMLDVIERSAEIILGCHAVGKPPPVLPGDIVTRLRRTGDMIA
jgi:phosphoglycerate dehydrogenase-like enzyme/ribulose-5-phosphate 4-epimerase/fuculose-1-phosphate aldolase/putative sterol carrier protein